MPKFRYAVLENDKAIAAATTSGTETIDLPERGILTEVLFQYRFAPGGTQNNIIIPKHLVIKKIELLVDGSTVVKSLTGRQAVALMWYNDGPYAINNNYRGGNNTNKAYQLIPLYLGRFAGDTLYGLDLSKYSNPQLKVEWDVTQTSVDGVTYDAYTSPTFTYNIMAKVLDGKPAGFKDMYVQSREVDSWTVADSGEHGTEIPRGFPLKGVMLGSRYTQKTWYSMMDKIKLDFDNGKWLPIDMDYENIAQAMKSWFPKAVVHKTWESLANGNDFNTEVMQVTGFNCGNPTAANKFLIWQSFEYPIHTISVKTDDGTAVTAYAAMWISIEGWGPQQTIYIPMKALVDGDQEMIKTTDYGRIDFKVTTASAGTSATSRVVAEYFKPNGE